MQKVSIQKIKWKLFLLGLFKIPLIHFVRPKLFLIDSEQCIVRIKLRRRTKNHLNSMYFGSMAVGADVAAGLHAYYFSEMYKKQISLAFKSMNAEFLKRAETDVYFKCIQGNKIEKMLKDSIKNQARVNGIISVVAMNNLDETVAKFEMELSIKVL